MLSAFYPSILRNYKLKDLFLGFLYTYAVTIKRQRLEVTSGHKYKNENLVTSGLLFELSCGGGIYRAQIITDRPEGSIMYF